MGGKPLGSQAQELILNVLQYFEAEKINKGPLIPVTSVQERVANALKISIRSVQTVIKRSQNNLNTTTLSISGIKTARIKPKTRDLAETTKMEIRNTLYDMYKDKKHVTLKNLNAELKAHNIIEIGHTSLGALLKELGFNYIRENRRTLLVENPAIAAKRGFFYRNYLENIKLPMIMNRKEVVFLGETSFSIQHHHHHHVIKQEANRNYNNRKHHEENYNKLKKFITIHAGTKNGFIQGAKLIIPLKSKKNDCPTDREEINYEIFKKWIRTQLIPNCPKSSLIILGDAPHHDILMEKFVNSLSPKQEIINWLNKHGISFDENMTKTELFHLANLNKSKFEEYEIDTILRDNGHQVLRIPPFHCRFNAIEFIWDRCKEVYNKNILKNSEYINDDEIAKRIWDEALAECTPHVWKRCVRHVEETIINYWYTREQYITENQDPINSSNNYSESDNSDEDSDY